MTKKPAFRAAVFFIALLLLLNALNFIFWDDIHSLSRVTISEMYDYDGNIDVVMLGSSYVVHGFNPDIADNIFGVNTFNAGTKMQTPDGSYYLLKEITKHHKLKTVYLDCSHIIMSQFNSASFDINSLISIYMKPSVNRFRFVYNSGGLTALVKNTFPFLIRKKLRFHTIVKAKLTDGYEKGNYKYVTFSDEAYMGNGFVRKSGRLKAKDNYAPIQEIDSAHPITDFSLEYLEKIASFCSENNIRLVLMAFPVASEMLSRIPNIQSYIDAVDEFALAHGLEYHNYNLVKSSFCRIRLSDYSDKEHLNANGADSFTRQFAITEKLLAAQSVTYEDVFYSTIAEKLEFDADETMDYFKAHPDSR